MPKEKERSGKERESGVKRGRKTGECVSGERERKGER